MACIYVFSTFLFVVAMQMLSAPEGGLGAILESYVASQDPTERLPGWPVFLSLLVVAAWLLSRFIRSGDESHYGWRGAVSWAAAGFVYAMWLRSVVQPVYHSGMRGAGNMGILLGLFGLLVSYGMAFGLGGGRVPRRRCVDG